MIYIRDLREPQHECYTVSCLQTFNYSKPRNSSKTTVHKLWQTFSIGVLIIHKDLGIPLNQETLKQKKEKY